MNRPATSVYACVLSCVIACGKSEPAKSSAGQWASIEGDMYLGMANGDTKKATGSAVSLVSVSPDALAAEIGAVCLQLKADIDVQLAAIQRAKRDFMNADMLNAVRDEEAAKQRIISRMGEAETAIRSAIHAHPEKVSVTDINARFHLDSIADGAYMLVGDWQMGTDRYVWWLPVSVAAGQKATVNLNNSNVAIGGYCGEPLDALREHRAPSRSTPSKPSS